MSIFDSLLSMVGSNVDVGSIAERVGIDPATAQQAVAALATAHPQDGDTVETAAAQSGIDPDTLTQVLGHIGGEGALGQIASSVASNPQLVQSVLGMFGGGGEAGAEGGLGGLIGGFLKRD